MASSVQSLPNHYDVLGLSPTATDEEVRQAFAKNMGMFGARPFAAAAQASLAFEVLRDPAKRREYDRLIGVAPKPTPKPEPYQWTFAVAPQRGLPFGPPVAPQAAAPRAAEPQVTAASAEAKRAEDKLASLIQSLRELSEPTAPPKAEAPEPPVLEQAQAKSEPVETPPGRAPQFVTLELADDGPSQSFLRQDWRRPAFVLGGLLVGTAILGAVAGLSVAGDNSPAQAEPALTVAVPAPKPQPAAVSEAPAPADWSAPVAAPQPRRLAKRQAAPTVIPQATAIEAAETPAVETAATDPLAPQAEAPQAVAARLPLSNATIARTIGRIGYACGSVASATAIEGAPGTFNVTCTSGHSYRAAPVHGRYRFKRLG